MSLHILQMDYEGRTEVREYHSDFYHKPEGSYESRIWRETLTKTRRNKPEKRSFLKFDKTKIINSVRISVEFMALTKQDYKEGLQMEDSVLEEHATTVYSGLVNEDLQYDGFDEWNY